MDLIERGPAQTQRHPWESARFAFFYRVCRHAGLFARPLSVLDVGAGDGWFGDRLLRRLPARSSVCCWDTGYGQTPPSSAGMRWTAEEPAGLFDAVFLLDVLEHVDDDLGFLRGIVERHVPRGGWVVASVPAWPSLFGPHDTRLRHHRRYRPAALRSLLERAGLTVRREGGLFWSLLPARWLALRLHRPSRSLGEWPHGPWITGAVHAALWVDGWISAGCARAGIPLPGLSAWALCQKPSL